MTTDVARSLRWRMVATVVLFVVCAGSFVGALARLYGWLVPALIDWWSRTYEVSADVGILAVFALGGVILWLAIGTLRNFFASPLSATRARPVSSDDRPDLHAVVRRLATQADLPKPDVALVRSSVPNAFTTGLTASSSTIVVTEGLLETLEDDELEAVLAHELAHISNRDGAVMTIGYLLPAAAFAVAKALTSPFSRPDRPGFDIDDDARPENSSDDGRPETVTGSVGDGQSSNSELDFPSFGRSSSGSTYTSGGSGWGAAVDGDDAEDTGKALVVLLAILVLTAILTFAIATIFWVFSYLLLLLLARTREYAADWAAVSLTGNPTALVNALTKLDDEMDAVPLTDLREMDGAVETLYIMPLRRGLYGFRDVLLLSDDLFPRTHPDTQDRIDRILAAAEN